MLKNNRKLFIVIAVLILLCGTYSLSWFYIAGNIKNNVKNILTIASKQSFKFFENTITYDAVRVTNFPLVPVIKINNLREVVSNNMLAYTQLGEIVINTNLAGNKITAIVPKQSLIAYQDENAKTHNTHIIYQDNPIINIEFTESVLSLYTRKHTDYNREMLRKLAKVNFKLPAHTLINNIDITAEEVGYSNGSEFSFNSKRSNADADLQADLQYIVHDSDYTKFYNNLSPNIAKLLNIMGSFANAKTNNVNLILHYAGDNFFYIANKKQLQNLNGKLDIINANATNDTSAIQMSGAIKWVSDIEKKQQSHIITIKEFNFKELQSGANINAVGNLNFTSNNMFPTGDIKINMVNYHGILQQYVNNIFANFISTMENAFQNKGITQEPDEPKKVMGGASVFSEAIIGFLEEIASEHNSENNSMTLTAHSENAGEFLVGKLNQNEFIQLVIKYIGEFNNKLRQLREGISKNKTIPQKQG